LEEVNQELEAFTYSVSHDLRAPLRHMAGFSGLLLEEFGSTLDSQARHYVNRIQEGTRKMGQLVDELLCLARVGRQTANLQMAGLDSMVEEVVAMLKPEWDGRDVEWKIAPLPSVECDQTLVKQVFQNLISNALKYSRPRRPAVIEVGPTQVDGELAIFVRDNGVGFNMRYADKLFGVFQRLHRPEDFEGTGVGLATAQRIVKKHGGRIWAEAELDKGATFYFTVGGSPHGETRGSAAVAGE
jgi:light-regulated signal transduction histidine kinase (bacteriophytochrome)